jgi:hypothetical protein
MKQVDVYVINDSARRQAMYEEIREGLARDWPKAEVTPHKVSMDSKVRIEVVYPDGIRREAIEATRYLFWEVGGMASDVHIERYSQVEASGHVNQVGLDEIHQWIADSCNHDVCVESFYVGDHLYRVLLRCRDDVDAIHAQLKYRNGVSLAA